MSPKDLRMLENRPLLVGSATASTLPYRRSMAHDMDCPECREHSAPMPGSTWAIAWYSCGKCGTFWYARLRVGPDANYSDRSETPLLEAPAPESVMPPRGARQNWTIEELEAEAAALRRESDRLPKGDLEALRQHLEKLKVLADAINQRLDAHAPAQTPRAS
jgi:hypothetical protein